MIKTGIASFGMSGKIFHAPFIQEHPSFELTAIVERNKDNSRERYPESILYRSFEEMLENKEIELVVVNTPVQTHFEYAQKALNAGKHIVVEKPFTIDAAEAIALDKLATEKGLLLTVYQNRRYDGDFAAVKQVVTNGLLGDIKEVELKYDRYRPEPGGKAHKEGGFLGSGTLHDLGAHLIDQAIQLFNMPNAVYADIRTIRSGVIANDYFELLCYYNGFVVRIKSSMLTFESTPAYMLHGSNGSYYQQRTDMQEEALAAGAIPSQGNWCPSPQIPDGFLYTAAGKQAFTSKSGNYMHFYSDVYAALTGVAPNPVPAADAVKSMRIIDAAFESDRTGKRIVL
jgi:scyllo-inositol 2-dehydrogenase (NADP+)